MDNVHDRFAQIRRVYRLYEGVAFVNKREEWHTA